MRGPRCGGRASAGSSAGYLLRRALRGVSPARPLPIAPVSRRGVVFWWFGWVILLRNSIAMGVVTASIAATGCSGTKTCASRWARRCASDACHGRAEVIALHWASALGQKVSRILGFSRLVATVSGDFCRGAWCVKEGREKNEKKRWPRTAMTCNARVVDDRSMSHETCSHLCLVEHVAMCRRTGEAARARYVAFRGSHALPLSATPLRSGTWKRVCLAH